MLKFQLKQNGITATFGDRKPKWMDNGVPSRYMSGARWLRCISNSPREFMVYSTVNLNPGQDDFVTWKWSRRPLWQSHPFHMANDLARHAFDCICPCSGDLSS